MNLKENALLRRHSKAKEKSGDPPAEPKGSFLANGTGRRQ